MREIKIIVSKGPWIQLFVLCVLDETVCVFVYTWGALRGSEYWQTSKVWLLLLSTAATTDLKIILDLWRDKCLVMNARFLFSFNKFQMPLAHEDVLILVFAWSWDVNISINIAGTPVLSEIWLTKGFRWSKNNLKRSRLVTLMLPIPKPFSKWNICYIRSNVDLRHGWYC